MKRITYFLLLVIVTISCKKSDDNPSVVVDIDGNEYEIIEIGEQIWMKSNLRVTKYSNGETIPNITAGGDNWGDLLSGALCYYNNDDSDKESHGSLYNAYAVNDERGLCPTGWHVPTRDDWQELMDFLGGENQAAPKMKLTTWELDEDPADNSSGLSIVPNGFRNAGGEYSNKNGFTVFWSSTIKDVNQNYVRFLNPTAFVSEDHYLKTVGASVRCVKD